MELVAGLEEELKVTEGQTDPKPMGKETDQGVKVGLEIDEAVGTWVIERKGKGKMLRD